MTPRLAQRAEYGRQTHPNATSTIPRQSVRPSLTIQPDAEREAEMVRGVWHLREAMRCFDLAGSALGGQLASGKVEILLTLLADYDATVSR